MSSTTSIGLLPYQVACALARGIPIITPSYFNECYLSQNAKKALPHSLLHAPPIVNNSLDAPTDSFRNFFRCIEKRKKVVMKIFGINVGDSMKCKGSAYPEIFSGGCLTQIFLTNMIYDKFFFLNYIFNI